MANKIRAEPANDQQKQTKGSQWLKLELMETSEGYEELMINKNRT
jgi:hypothetical protein